MSAADKDSAWPIPDQYYCSPYTFPKSPSQQKYSPSLSLVGHMLRLAPHILKDEWKVKFIVLASQRSMHISIHQVFEHTPLLCVSFPPYSAFGGKLSERFQTEYFLPCVLRDHLSQYGKYSSLGK